MIRIVKDNAKSLRAKSKPVEMPLSPADKALLDEMIEYLRLSQDAKFREEHPKVREGVGLAAPQVDTNKRMLVVLYPAIGKEGEYVKYELVNPTIVVNSLKKSYLESGEGCLSVDDPHPGHVFRDYKVTVKAYEALTDKNVLIKAEGFDAIVLQHEIDHLDGILFYDHIDSSDPMKVLPGSVAI
jgi:peptide deformylase